MKLDFWKVNGAGNDFVVVDNRDGRIELSETQIARLCDRRRGVGADGFIAIEPAAHGHDFFMRFHNSDGVEAEMCGNGARCSAYVAVSLGIGRVQEGASLVRFLTGSGAIGARVAGTRVTMSMMDAQALRRDVPVQVSRSGGPVHFMTVGTRHAVVVVDDATAMSARDVVERGRALRHDPAFAPQGANVNFASMGRDGRIHLRTYEKGVEAETYACGTGSVAAAVIFAQDGLARSPAQIVQHSGDVLTASFVLNDTGAEQVHLEGPVAENFRGWIDV